MAQNPKLSTASRNLGLNAALDVLNGGTVKFYDGTKPATPDVAVTTQNLLATLNLGNPAMSAASGGTKTGNAITSANATANGTCTWARLCKADGTAVYDVEVGTSGADLNVSSTAFTVGTPVNVTSWAVSQAP